MLQLYSGLGYEDINFVFLPFTFHPSTYPYNSIYLNKTKSEDNAEALPRLIKCHRSKANRQGHQALLISSKCILKFEASCMLSNVA